MTSGNKASDPTQGESTQADGASLQRANWPSSLEGQTEGHWDWLGRWEVKAEQREGSGEGSASAEMWRKPREASEHPGLRPWISLPPAIWEPPFHQLVSVLVAPGRRP